MDPSSGENRGKACFEAWIQKQLKIVSTESQLKAKQEMSPLEMAALFCSCHMHTHACDSGHPLLGGGKGDKKRRKEVRWLQKQLGKLRKGGCRWPPQDEEVEEMLFGSPEKSGASPWVSCRHCFGVILGHTCLSWVRPSKLRFPR